MIETITHTEQDTLDLAKKIAAVCFAGDLILLSGDLGAGKSVFARGLIIGLMPDKQSAVKSEPTRDLTAAVEGQKPHGPNVSRAQAKISDWPSTARELDFSQSEKEYYIPSPTFTLMNPYEDTRLPVVHVDCYRLGDPDELYALELEPWLAHGVSVIEWPEKGGDYFAKERHGDLLDYHIATMSNAGRVHITLEECEGGRKLTFDASPSWEKRLRGILGLVRAQTEEGREKFLLGVDPPGLRRGRLLRRDDGNLDLQLVSSGDWSARSYWRLENEKKLLMDAPAEDVTRFEKVAAFYRESLDGTKSWAPRIYKTDVENGYILMDDFGDVTVFDQVRDFPFQTKHLLTLAVEALVAVAKAPLPDLRRYTTLDLWLEAARFCDEYLPAVRGHATSPEERQRLKDVMAPLFETILGVPEMVVHWDFHTQNLMLKSNGDLGLIDLQDARVGPVTYDLATLLRNDRLAIDKALEEDLLEKFMAETGVEPDAFMNSYRLTIVGRMMKVLGGLARLRRISGERGGLDRIEKNAAEILRSELAVNPLCAKLKQTLQELLPEHNHLC